MDSYFFAEKSEMDRYSYVEESEMDLDVHPWHQHPLEEVDDDQDLEKICQVCMCSLSLSNYRCKYGCDYHLHFECLKLIKQLKDNRQVHHPLHPQHHLILHDYIDAAAGDDPPNLIRSKFEFNVCSFCNQTIESEFFFHCSSTSSSSISLSCDFYLHIACSTGFMHHPELLSNFHIQHLLHYPDDINHRLSPYILNGLINDFYFRCEGYLIGLCSKDILFFKCITCDFYLHVQCSQILQGIPEQYCYHPQHPLTLLPYSRATTESNVDKLHCHACWCNINEEPFVLHCTECSNFNLHITCASLKPYTIPNCHDHPLVHFKEIYLEDVLCDVLCSACKTPCEEDSFRCMPCNYSIHPHCIPLPITVDDDDVHVHPLTLTPSFKEVNPTDCYCDVCETKRAPNPGVYLCEECRFVAHFHCALKNHPLMLEGWFHQKLEDGASTSSKEDDKRTIILQLDSEVTELKQLVQKLVMGQQEIRLIKMFEVLDEKQAKTEAIISQLKEKF